LYLPPRLAGGALQPTQAKAGEPMLPKRELYYGQHCAVLIMRHQIHKTLKCCLICGRILDNPTDPLSEDCGGDCWGCVGEIEAGMGDACSLGKVRKEFEAGLRPEWHDPEKP
jgi:hypothetical protein